MNVCKCFSLWINKMFYNDYKLSQYLDIYLFSFQIIFWIFPGRTGAWTGHSEICYCWSFGDTGHFYFAINVLFIRLKGQQNGQGCVSSAPTSIFTSRWLMTPRCTRLLQLQQCRNPSLRSSTIALDPLL